MDLNLGTLKEGITPAKVQFRDSIKIFVLVLGGGFLIFFDTHTSILKVLSSFNMKFDSGSLTQGIKVAKFQFRVSMKYVVLVLGWDFQYFLTPILQS